MAVRLDKPWQALNEATLKRIGAQLGVFELADRDGEITYIGVADARSLFGLRGELAARVGTAPLYRVEVNTAYRTRHRELLMSYYADHDRYPLENTDAETRDLGRLSP